MSTEQSKISGHSQEPRGGKELRLMKTAQTSVNGVKLHNDHIPARFIYNYEDI